MEAFDVDATLAHELVHCLQRRGGSYDALPAWAREGAALYVADQGASRARALATIVGIDASRERPVAALVDGLEGAHDLHDYYEDAAAFEVLGEERAVAFARGLLKQADPGPLLKEVAGMTIARLDEAARGRAMEILAPLVEEGRADYLTARAKLDAGDAKGALAALAPRGAYAAPSALVRAAALRRLGRDVDALRHLRNDFLKNHRPQNPLLADALALELELLDALAHPEAAECRRRSKLDWTVFGK
jgi:hypothetical protein